jgi:lysophospholipase L1-like esterase
MDLGCPGETTSSMTSTPAQKQCVTVYSEEFGARTQVAAALSFLSRHKGQVSDVTIDIGANDLDNCISGTNVNTSCLEQHLGAATTNIGAIVRELQSALRQSDPQARMIAMNYYDPFLGLAFSPGGSHGAQLASASLAATLLFNGELATTYGNFHVPLANVAAAFRIDALNPVTPFDGKKFPANVATNCQLTWMCPTTTAHGPDIHPDLAGYRAIAGAFEKLLAS